MNILYISSKKRWGGVVSWIVRTAQDFQKRGHQCWIISAKKSEFTQKAPADIRLIPRKFGMDYNPYLIYYLVQFIKENQIQIIATNIKKEVIVAGIAARICRIPCVRFIGNERDFIRIQKFLQQRLIDQNILPCEKVKQISLAQHPWLSPERMNVIYIGHNAVQFSEEEIQSQKKCWGIVDNSLVIGVTGRLVKSKGVALLIKAFASLAQKYPQTFLVITGTGNYQPDLVKLVNHLELSNKVIFAGFAQDSLLSAVAYDIAVLPSLHEAFPYTIVEYFAAGRPVIATRVGGVDEIIQDGVNGFLIDINGEQQLIEKLSVLIEDKKLREQFSHEAINSINQKFSQDLMMDKFEALFRSMIYK